MHEYCFVRIVDMATRGGYREYLAEAFGPHQNALRVCGSRQALADDNSTQRKRWGAGSRVADKTRRQPIREIIHASQDLTLISHFSGTDDRPESMCPVSRSA